MNWLRESISDSATGKASSKRIAMLAGAVSMSLAVVVLSAASLFGYDVAAALWAVTLIQFGAAFWFGDWVVMHLGGFIETVRGLFS